MGLERERHQKEQFDAPAELLPVEEYRAAVRGVERSNRVWGGMSVVLRPLEEMVHRRNLTSFTVLDVGCGGGDIDEELVKTARARHLGMTLIGIDSNSHAVHMARERLAGYSEVNIIHADFFEAKFSDASFDIVIASQLLHHLTDTQMTFFLWKAYSVARVGVILTDLRRCSWACMLCRLALRLTAPRSPIYAADAALSFRRAYTLREMRDILVRGRYPYMATVPWCWPFRMILEAERLPVEKR